MNKNIYTNTILFTLGGTVAFISLAVCTFVLTPPKSTQIIWLFCALYVTYLGFQVKKYLHAGHKVHCAMRRMLIDLSRA